MLIINSFVFKGRYSLIKKSTRFFNNTSKHDYHSIQSNDDNKVIDIPIYQIDPTELPSYNRKLIEDIHNKLDDLKKTDSNTAKPLNNIVLELEKINLILDTSAKKTKENDILFKSVVIGFAIGIIIGLFLIIYEDKVRYYYRECVRFVKNNK